MQGPGCRVQVAGYRVQGAGVVMGYVRMLGSPVIFNVIYIAVDFSAKNLIFFCQ